jgi:vancomycin resistance protein YoaR
MRGFAWALLIPLTTITLLGGVVFWQAQTYLAKHEERIYTGVNILGVDVGQKTHAEAITLLNDVVRLVDTKGITLVDPQTEQADLFSRSSLSIAVDVEAMVLAAYSYGRVTDQPWQEILHAWYRGHEISPVWIIDENGLDERLQQLAVDINRPAQPSKLALEEGDILQTEMQPGRTLDYFKLRSLIMSSVGAVDNVIIELPLTVELPEQAITSAAAEEASQILSNSFTLYIDTPRSPIDLERVEISVAQLQEWTLIQNDTSGAHILFNNVAIRQWLEELAESVNRPAERARFYFDDLTGELVLTQPHISGRTLNIDITLEHFLEQVRSPRRSIALVFDEIVPDVHSNVTAEELGIIELLSEETTYFYGSSPERKHNIRVGASKFHGIVVGPGEQFSFNNYLGEISEEAGYQEGLVIIGGRTVGGVGGGICQVSTTLFQTVFWSGLSIGARNQHGYRVIYYEMAPDGESKPLGMDAAIYSPIVDFTFENNSPHYLLVESYYSDIEESVTFKFYSTNLGRTVEREIIITNETEAGADRYELNPELDSGEIKQVEWAAEGADVTVHRIVNNKWGELRDEDYFISEYEPWANVYQYGLGTELPDLQEAEVTDE